VEEEEQEEPPVSPVAPSGARPYQGSELYTNIPRGSPPAERADDESFYGDQNIRSGLSESAIKFMKYVRFQFWPDFRWNNRDHEVIIYDTRDMNYSMYIFDIVRYYFGLEIGRASVDELIPRIFRDQGWQVARGAIELRLFLQTPFPMADTSTRDALKAQFPGISDTALWQLEEIIKSDPEVYNMRMVQRRDPTRFGWFFGDDGSTAASTSSASVGAGAGTGTEPVATMPATDTTTRTSSSTANTMPELFTELSQFLNHTPVRRDLKPPPSEEEEQDQQEQLYEEHYYQQQQQAERNREREEREKEAERTRSSGGLRIAHQVVKQNLGRHFNAAGGIRDKPQNSSEHERLETETKTAVRVSESDDFPDPKLIYNSDTKCFYFKLKEGEEWEFVHPDMRFMLGFDRDHGHPVRPPIDGSNRKSVVSVRHPADFSVFIRQMYVYMNIIRPVPVGWQELKLMRILPIRLDDVQNDNLMFSFERPEYHTLSEATIREIHVMLRTVMGKEMPFSRGRTKIKLHFRKKRATVL